MTSRRTKKKPITRRGFGSSDDVHARNTETAIRHAAESAGSATEQIKGGDCETAFFTLRTGIESGEKANSEAYAQSDARLRKKADDARRAVDDATDQFVKRCVRRKP